MTHTPEKAITNPAMASLANFSPLKKVIITIQIGKIAFIIAPSPLLMYFTPQVLKPLLKAKFKMLKIKEWIKSKLLTQNKGLNLVL